MKLNIHYRKFFSKLSETHAYVSTTYCRTTKYDQRVVIVMSAIDLQKKAITLSKPIREEAIISLYSNTLPRSLAIADLGCSSGPNTFSVVSELIKTLEKLCRKLNHKSPEYRVFLNDLPGNDFNSIFNSLDNFKEKLQTEVKGGIGPCYFSGVPGSFYGRVFPDQSLHFVHSSYSLQWLSKVNVYLVVVPNTT